MPIGGIELISGIGCFNSKEWREHLKIVWKVLETFDIELSERCGTHVHVSVKDCKWTSTQVENLALAVNLFEKATEILVPKDRLSNSYCKSNRHNPRLAMLTMPEVFDAVKKCSEAPRQEHGAADAAPTDGHTNFEALASLVCYCGKAPCGKDIYERSFRWNFTPLAKVDGNGPKNTVEFRLPSGSTFAEHTIAWIEFTGFFVLAAIDSSYNLDGNRIPWLKDLRDFIHAGAKRAGIDDMQFIDFIFDGKIDPEFSGTLRHLTHRRSRSDDSISASTRQSWGDLIIHRRSRSDTPLSAAFENMLKSDYRKQVPERSSCFFMPNEFVLTTAIDHSCIGDTGLCYCTYSPHSFGSGPPLQLRGPTILLLGGSEDFICIALARAIFRGNILYLLYSYIIVLCRIPLPEGGYLFH